MTPDARIKANLEIMEKCAASSRIPMDGVVGDYMRHRRYIGSKDRAEIAERAYEIVRHHARLSWWLEQLKIKDNPRNRMIVWLKLGENADVDRIFSGSKYGAEQLSKDEHKILKALEGQVLAHDDMPETVKVECPQQYEEKLRGYFGDDFAIEMAAMIPSATLDLRVNTWSSDVEKAQESLHKSGIRTDKCEYAVNGLRVKGKAYLAKTKAFLKGWVEIQDEGSQLIGQACDAQPGMQVLDYCAGAGGKTLCLASAMQNKGRIVAMDLDEARLSKAKPRLKKAGVHDIVELRALSEDRGKKWLKRQKGTFDIVLTDVPCTGTGTWRRNPDMRWRNYGPSLEELVVVQADILDRVTKAVKPGGKLVYATCSLLPDENEKQIEAFLARNDEFEKIPVPEGIPSENGFMRLTPHRHNTDGFFAAVLRKKEA